MSDTGSRKADPGTEQPGGSVRRAFRRGPDAKRAISPLTLRILALNVGALLILVLGVLYLGQYKSDLVAAELEALRAEARMFAGVIAEGAVVRIGDDQDVLSDDLASRLVRSLGETTQNRTRLYSTDNTLVGDSHQLVGPGGVVEIVELPPPTAQMTVMELTRNFMVGVLDVLPSSTKLPEYPATPENKMLPDVERALTGLVSATAWSDSEGGVILMAAAPVQPVKKVLGAVLVSHDGSKIDEAIRTLQLDIIRVFLAAFGITVTLSVYLSEAITRPIIRLARAARKVQHARGRVHDIPDFTHRGDEIGDLSGAFRDMTQALWKRIDAIEAFAADVAHELKNPLTSLRSAVETAGRITDPEKQKKLMGIIEHDVTRLDRLITDISNASRLDAELQRTTGEEVDLRSLLDSLSRRDENIRRMGETDRENAPRMRLLNRGVQPLVVFGSESRLMQVFSNLVDNALSFSPPGGTVTVEAGRTDHQVVITVTDEGPGIPENKLDGIFDRFYSERPRSEAYGEHSGLGLSIARQIVEAHKGAIYAENMRDADGEITGARFTVELPAV